MAAGAVALVASLPLAYVVVRAIGAGGDVWSSLLDERIPSLLGTTILLAVVVTGAAVALGAGFAYLVVRTDVPCRRLLAVLAAVPLAIPPFVGAIVYASLLGPKGDLQQLLEPLGVERLPSIYGFGGAALVLVLFTYPYAFMLAGAALASLSRNYEEAARALGRTRLQVVIGTTFRMITPALAGGALLVGLHVLSDFGTVALMRLDTFTRVIFIQLSGEFDIAGAAVLSSLLVLLSLAMLAAARGVRGGGSYEQTSTGLTPPPLHALGRWRWPAFGACALVITLSLLVPLATLVAWTADTLPDQDLADYAGWAWNSLSLALVAAAVALLCALPVAAVAVRRRGRAATAISSLAQAGFALPGVIVALALVAISTRYLNPLYGTLTLLVVAFVIRFLPEAIQGMESGIGQIGGELSEAARGLGAGRLETGVRVVLPLLRPSMVAAWVVVFLSSLKELPITLVLRPLDFDTLAVRVWTPARSGLYAEAGPAALMLVLVSLVPLYFILVRRRGLLPALS